MIAKSEWLQTGSTYRWLQEIRWLRLQVSEILAKSWLMEGLASWPWHASTDDDDRFNIRVPIPGWRFSVPWLRLSFTEKALLTSSGQSSMHVTLTASISSKYKESGVTSLCIYSMSVFACVNTVNLKSEFYKDNKPSNCSDYHNSPDLPFRGQICVFDKRTLWAQYLQMYRLTEKTTEKKNSKITTELSEPILGVTLRNVGAFDFVIWLLFLCKLPLERFGSFLDKATYFYRIFLMEAMYTCNWMYKFTIREQFFYWKMEFIFLHFLFHEWHWHTSNHKSTGNVFINIERRFTV